MEVHMDRRKQLCGLLLWILLPGIAQAQDVDPKYEAGGFVTYGLLREVGSRDSAPGTEVAGFGGRFAYRVHPYLNLESEISFLPGNPATSGNHLQGFAGVKAGKRWDRSGVFVKVRPGFIRFSRDPFGVGKSGAAFPSHDRAASTEPAIDLGGVMEYYTSREMTLRLDVGYDLIHYARREVHTSPILPGFEAGGFTTHNWIVSFGAGFRF
jgi:hypothetical protein